MALHAKVTHNPVFQDGKYLCRVETPTAGERPAGKFNKEPTPGIQWVFIGVKKDKNNVASELIANDVVKGKPEKVRFAILTGDTYGPKRAALTKFLPVLAGRPLTKDEVDDMDLEAFGGTFLWVTVITDTADDGSLRNKIVKFENADVSNAPTADNMFGDPEAPSDPLGE